MRARQARTPVLSLMRAHFSSLVAIAVNPGFYTCVYQAPYRYQSPVILRRPYSSQNDMNAARLGQAALDGCHASRHDQATGLEESVPPYNSLRYRRGHQPSTVHLVFYS